jgi:hypothetical protein
VIVVDASVLASALGDDGDDGDDGDPARQRRPLDVEMHGGPFDSAVHDAPRSKRYQLAKAPHIE